MDYYIQLALSVGEVGEAKVYIEKLRDDDLSKLQYYLEIKDWKHALPLAQTLYHVPSLTVLSREIENESLRNQASRLLADITRKRDTKHTNTI